MTTHTITSTLAAYYYVVGSIFLVWGNDGEDIVADYSWRESYSGSEAIMGKLAA